MVTKVTDIVKRQWLWQVSVGNRLKLNASQINHKNLITCKNKLVVSTTCTVVILVGIYTRGTLYKQISCFNCRVVTLVAWFTLILHPNCSLIQLGCSIKVNHATRVTTLQLKQLICFYSVHDMQQALRKAEPGDYKHAVNGIVGMKMSKEVANVGLLYMYSSS